MIMLHYIQDNMYYMCNSVAYASDTHETPHYMFLFCTYDLLYELMHQNHKKKKDIGYHHIFHGNQ
jgi:hypothetical protein